MYNPTHPTRCCVYKIVLFDELSVHLQSDQCLILYVKTLIILPKKCRATSSLVSGFKIGIYETYP